MLRAIYIKIKGAQCFSAKSFSPSRMNLSGKRFILSNQQTNNHRVFESRLINRWNNFSLQSGNDNHPYDTDIGEINMNVSELMEIIKAGNFGKDNIEAYLDVISVFGNENEDISDELSDLGDKSYLFKVDGLDYEFWLKVEDEKLSWGKDAIEDPTLIYTLKVDVCVGIIAGTADSTGEYMKGNLKIEGSLRDATNFVSLLELIRDEMEDA